MSRFRYNLSDNLLCSITSRIAQVPMSVASVFIVLILPQHAMKAWGEPIDDDDIAEMLKVADVAPDGKIDYMGRSRVQLTRINA